MYFKSRDKAHPPKNVNRHVELPEFIINRSSKRYTKAEIQKMRTTRRLRRVPELTKDIYLGNRLVILEGRHGEIPIHYHVTRCIRRRRRGDGKQDALRVHPVAKKRIRMAVKKRIKLSEKLESLTATQELGIMKSLRRRRLQREKNELSRRIRFRPTVFIKPTNEHNAQQRFENQLGVEETKGRTIFHTHREQKVKWGKLNLITEGYNDIPKWCRDLEKKVSEHHSSPNTKKHMHWSFWELPKSPPIQPVVPDWLFKEALPDQYNMSSETYSHKLWCNKSVTIHGKAVSEEGYILQTLFKKHERDWNVPDWLFTPSVPAKKKAKQSKYMRWLKKKQMRFLRETGLIWLTSLSSNEQYRTSCLSDVESEEEEEEVVVKEDTGKVGEMIFADQIRERHIGKYLDVSEEMLFHWAREERDYVYNREHNKPAGFEFASKVPIPLRTEKPKAKARRLRRELQTLDLIKSSEEPRTPQSTVINGVIRQEPVGMYQKRIEQLEEYEEQVALKRKLLIEAEDEIEEEEAFEKANELPKQNYFLIQGFEFPYPNIAYYMSKLFVYPSDTDRAKVDRKIRRWLKSAIEIYKREYAYYTSDIPTLPAGADLGSSMYRGVPGLGANYSISTKR